MTQPRQVLPGKTYLITRRTSERRFFLKPVTAVCQVFCYVLAVAATRHDIRVHAYCCLSNHFHLIVTDVHGTLPEFMHILDSLLARALNCWWGRWESFWAPRSYSRVELLEGPDVIDKMIYTLANPVSSGLVETSTLWPGPRSGVLEGGVESRVCTRPSFFFRPEGALPETVELRVVRPEAGSDLSNEEFSNLLRTRIAEREGECRAELEREGRSFLGRKRILEQSAFDSPKTAEPRGQLDPRIAAKDKRRRTEALQSLRCFLDAYRQSYQKFKDGVRDVLFPAGTYWLRRFVGVHCETAPT